ncbi:MAG: UDP-3-O-acyl-N-acetylglucosamine deacetylase [Proteobacteria bacterium]|nr:UDP-3-O-acyl-N-acetylglucosamine deacetylase [Pseudomonadota bacterium]
MERERTIAKPVSVSGIGLHSGAKTFLTLKPAPPGSGITFFRPDLDPSLPIPARIDYVGDNRFATTLRRGEAEVATVEHLLAAVYSLEVDNLEAWLEGPEVPSGDGSAQIFVDLITAAGLKVQERDRSIFSIPYPLEAVNPEARITAGPEPGNGLSLEFRIAYPRLQVPEQTFHLRLSPELFRREIASARTYGFLEDLSGLKAEGKGKGGSLENAILISDGKVVNPEGLRFPEELVRHKILDLIGDLALLGRRVSGRVAAQYSGHCLNHQLVREISKIMK